MMPRAAGNKNYYEFVLRSASGRYLRNTTIQLPSVTTILGATLAKPMLVGWAYRFTRDVASSLAAMAVEGIINWGDLLDTMSDPDEFEAFLKENKLRPDDTKNERAEEGTAGHDFLEDLAKTFLEGGEVAAQKKAGAMLSSSAGAPEKKAIAGWWLDRNPQVERAEGVLFSLLHGFAGTVDLIWWDEDGNLVLTDLKTRKEGSSAYDSDHLQCNAYEIAWNEWEPKHIDRRTVLIARLDGTWDEYEGSLDNQVFLDVLSVYKGLRR
jgi:hypothetical protein